MKAVKLGGLLSLLDALPMEGGARRDVRAKVLQAAAAALVRGFGRHGVNIDDLGALPYGEQLRRVQAYLRALLQRLPAAKKMPAVARDVRALLERIEQWDMEG